MAGQLMAYQRYGRDTTNKNTISAFVSTGVGFHAGHFRLDFASIKDGKLAEIVQLQRIDYSVQSDGGKVVSTIIGKTISTTGIF